SSLLKMRLIGAPSLLASSKPPKRRVISVMCSSLSSLRLLPRLLRIFCQKLLASISCTLPLRAAGLRFDRIQTYVEIPAKMYFSVGHTWLSHLFRPEVD